jgi:ketosteroid isomerase-like protein
MTMKSAALLVAVLALVGACAPKSDNPADVQAIKDMVTAYGKAASAGDAAAIVSPFYTDDAVRLEPNMAMERGKDALLAGWKSFLDQYQVDEQDVAEDVLVRGDLAVARGTFISKATPKASGGAVIDDQGKFLSVFRRGADGTWKCFTDMWNTDRPVAQVLTPASADEQALLQIERDWAEAWRKMDGAALEKILAPGFVESSGDQATTKAQMLASMKAGVYKVEVADAKDMKALVFGDHAVVNGTSVVKQTVKGKEESFTTRWTDTFERRDGRWQAVVSYNVRAK